MKVAIRATTNSLELSMLRMAAFDPVSFAVMGFGILVTAILPFVF
jgi:hypothetical protein